jgi:serine/threonine protein kinase
MRNKRMQAADLARRSSADFCDAYGESSLDSIAPFERDEIVLGQPVGSGAFSTVYEIEDIRLRTNPSHIYTEEQTKKREATAKSVKINNVKFVMKCLKDDVEVKRSDDEHLFLDAAHDIVHEAEMLAALSHPNIIKLHGIIASRHDAFLDGASAFFIILERLERGTLRDKIELWKKQNGFNPSRSLRSLSTSLSSSIIGDTVEKASVNVDEDGSLDNRLRVATSIASAVEYLHSKSVIFHDIKPENIGLDMQGTVKVFDFGLARFMPQDDVAYEEVFEISGAGTARYKAPEVFFEKPYNLKADVYSFSVVLWEMVCLQKPFAKCKLRRDFEKALSKSLVINRRWPKPIQDIIKRGLSRDLSARPTMREIHNALNEYVSNSGGVKGCDEERTNTSSPAPQQLGKSIAFPGRLTSSRVLRKFGSSFNSGSAMSVALTLQKDCGSNHLSDVTGTSAESEDSLKDVEEWERRESLMMDGEEKPREH